MERVLLLATILLFPSPLPGLFTLAPVVMSLRIRVYAIRTAGFLYGIVGYGLVCLPSLALLEKNLIYYSY